MASVMVLQAFEGLSDAEVVDRLSFDLRSQAAAGVDMNCPGFLGDSIPFLGDSIPWKRGWDHGKRRADEEPSTRRYAPAEREQAVRLVRQLRKELGTDQAVVARVARQLGYGVESVRSWVKQAHIDEGQRPGTTSEDAERMRRSY